MSKCHHCGKDTGMNDPPSGVCSVACLNAAQGFTPPGGNAMTTGDNVNVTEDFARLGPATVCGTEDRDGREFVIVRPAEPDGWEDFGEPQGDGTWAFPRDQVFPS